MTVLETVHGFYSSIETQPPQSLDALEASGKKIQDAAIPQLVADTEHGPGDTVEPSCFHATQSASYHAPDPDLHLFPTQLCLIVRSPKPLSIAWQARSNRAFRQF